MTALYTFDVYSTLDGYGSYGLEGDWGGYWGKQGPEFLDRRLALYREPQRLVLGAKTMRMFMQSIGPQTGFLKDVDPVNGAMRNLPTYDSRLDDARRTPRLARRDPGSRRRRRRGRPAQGGVRRASAVARQPVDEPRARGRRAWSTECTSPSFPWSRVRRERAPIFEGAADFDLELIESRTLDGHTQELIYRPTLHG